MLVEDGVALDCEMMQLRTGRQVVARVAIVSWDETILLDEYVCVAASEVGDYVTRISGVREEHLVGTRPFEAVQAAVCAYVENTNVYTPSPQGPAFQRHRHSTQTERN